MAKTERKCGKFERESRVVREGNFFNVSVRIFLMRRNVRTKKTGEKAARNKEKLFHFPSSFRSFRSCRCCLSRVLVLCGKTCSG